ncbi:MAG: hypothetical protein ABL891_02195 [Burkholderiales bacterium]
MTERLQGFQNVSNGITWVVPLNKILFYAKTLGCCIVAAAAMVVVNANATMTTKKDAGAAPKNAPSAPASDAPKKKDVVKDAGSVAGQEAKLAPKPEKKQMPK